MSRVLSFLSSLLAASSLVLAMVSFTVVGRVAYADEKLTNPKKSCADAFNDCGIQQGGATCAGVCGYSRSCSCTDSYHGDEVPCYCDV
jgi:hypothetical protein